MAAMLDAASGQYSPERDAVKAEAYFERALAVSVSSRR
jgi:hypothetical protein